MTNLHYHLFEIKLRFIYLTFSAIFTFLLSYNYPIELVYIIGKPFIELEQTFIFLELTEAFYTLLRISTIITLLLIIPFFFYHIWSFFIPSFYQIERTQIFFFFFFILCLFVTEILITYLILLPKICNFLISFEITSEKYPAGLHLEPLISVEFTARIESYVKLIVKIFTMILILFQIPLCVCLLYSKKFLHVSNFYDNRKFLILLSLSVSALIVPPDLLSQLVLAFCFFLLFETLIFLGFFFE
uniref:SecY-independent transporter protein n=2 Tax=Chlorella TaxID=3071 RepID=A0A097P5X1_CHLVA|nr:SecY-independent transporter protein [Chlorella variabilis]AIU38971.1 SecY-independent transporter protein [Chlorella variabilis]AJP09430.1 SecY-independent transporter protein [Chlorella variabilis]AST08877.1 SecY-independent transporter protein [Chlorella sp. ATCC 30562]